MGTTAKIRMVSSCRTDRSATENRVWSPGTNSTAARSTTPASKAMTLQGLLMSFSRMMECWLRQLKPWNSLARVRVAKAMVLATAWLPGVPLNPG